MLARIPFALLFAGLLVLPASPARAHCDTEDGPVVQDARRAFAKGDVTPVLKWVKAERESEITAAFAKAKAVRGQGDAARELAETWFVETLVRVHREGEGASYTGVKPAGTKLPHAVVAADKALEGKLAPSTLSRHLSSMIAEGVNKRFAAVSAAKKRAEESVEAGRAFVAAYVDYVHFAEAVEQLAQGGGHGGEAKTAASHAH